MVLPSRAIRESGWILLGQLEENVLHLCLCRGKRVYSGDKCGRTSKQRRDRDESC